MTDNLPTAPLEDFIQNAQKHRQSKAHNPITGAILRFNGKTGEWALGADEIDVEGEELLIMTNSLSHGYARWGQERPVTSYSLVTQPLPQPPEPYEGVDQDGKPKTFVAQDARRFFGAFMDEELGQFTFETHSMGGVQRVDELMDEIFLRAVEEPVYLYPRVKLGSDYYKRDTGKVYKPVFEVVAWCDVDGNPMSDTKKIANTPNTDTDDEQEEAPPTRRRRRRAAV